MLNWLKFSKNKLRFDNIVFWIVLLFVFNAIAVVIYLVADPSDNLSVQIWNYLESATFKVITISLVLPIIMFVLEKRFKIAENVRQNRFIRERKEEEERKEKRWECIEETTKVWNQLWDLTSEIIYFKKDKDQGKTIEDLLIRLRNLTTSAEDVINMWKHRFPDLPYEYHWSFLVFFETELNSAETVAWCIRHSKNTREIRKLQNSLKRIVESINYMVHHHYHFIDDLKYSIELLELKEAKAPEDEQHAKLELIRSDTEDLEAWASAIKDEEYNNNEIFSFVDTDDVKDYRNAYQKLLDWLRKHPGKDPTTDYTNFDKIKKLYYKIPHEQAGPNFSGEYLKYLANWLGFECQRFRLLGG